MFEEILQNGAGEMGISLPAGAIPYLREYHDYLYEKNKVMDLTAVPEGEPAIRSHFLDSLSLLPYIPEGASVIDVGSGAGFPGLPLKIARTDMKLTLMDANGKRTGFLKELCPRVGAEDVEILTGRAEELTLEEKYREQYDICVSRAVASMSMLCELCLPFVKVGGMMLAMKASGSEEELETASRAVSILGGKLEKKIKYRVPGTEAERYIIPIRKISETPKTYPRRFAKIKSKPL